MHIEPPQIPIGISNCDRSAFGQYDKWPHINIMSIFRQKIEMALFGARRAYYNFRNLRIYSLDLLWACCCCCCCSSSALPIKWDVSNVDICIIYFMYLIWTVFIACVRACVRLAEPIRRWDELNWAQLKAKSKRATPCCVYTIWHIVGDRDEWERKTEKLAKYATYLKYNFV